MNRERLMQVLVEPKISEKAARAADMNRQYVFQVLPDATKPEIKAAVEARHERGVQRLGVEGLQQFGLIGPAHGGKGP